MGRKHKRNKDILSVSKYFGGAYESDSPKYFVRYRLFILRDVRLFIFWNTARPLSQNFTGIWMQRLYVRRNVWSALVEAGNCIFLSVYRFIYCHIYPFMAK